MIPKKLREQANVKKESYVKIKANSKSIVIKPLKPIADKYFGTFKITKWPENLDKFIVEVTSKWWTRKAT